MDMPAHSKPRHLRHPIAFLLLIAFLAPHSLYSEDFDSAAIIRGIDASVAARNDALLGYTATEHYVVFRNHDLQHPAAEMTVRTTFKKELGKHYDILSESGSELIRKEVLARVLDNERTLTQPANRAAAIITSANYNMTVTGRDTLNGRVCYVISLQPRRNSPYLFKGRVWVDAKDYAIVQLQGVTAKSPSMLTGPTQVQRQYEEINGYPMATHAHAVSSSWLLGETTLKIDYTGYEMDLHSGQ